MDSEIDSLDGGEILTLISYVSVQLFRKYLMLNFPLTDATGQAACP
jgi:hypothetical protein